MAVHTVSHLNTVLGDARNECKSVLSKAAPLLLHVKINIQSSKSLDGPNVKLTMVIHKCSFQYLNGVKFRFLSEMMHASEMG